MSKRRTVLQLDDIPPPHGSPSSRHHERMPTPDSDDNDDSMGDMPTPERLVTPDMMPPKSELDNKVANFLAEIDALDQDDENSSTSPVPMTTGDREEEPAARFQMSPAREGFMVSAGRDRTPPPAAASKYASNAYSNMFVKGTPEFTKKHDDKRHDREKKVELEHWPEEPKTDWQQLIDESTKYPYYWNVVTNDVVWDIPSEFSAFLLLQKEYEEKVERGLREGKLDPAMRNKKTKEEASGEMKESEPEHRRGDKNKDSSSRSDKPESQSRRYASGSEDSSSDSSDSETDQPTGHKSETTVEVPSSSTGLSGKDSLKDSYKKKNKSSDTVVLPDSTETVYKGDKKSQVKGSSSNEDAADFDIDDIDKELELALERKKKEHSKGDDKRKGDDDKDRSKDRDRKKDHKHRSEESRDDKRHDDDRRKHKHKDHDRDRDRKHRSQDKEDKKPKLTLKERLRIEMELKLEKERRKKKAIEEMMTRELEKTVAGSRSQKRHRDDRDEPRKRDRYSRDDEDGRMFADGSGRRGYDAWDRDRRAPSYEDRMASAPYYKPPPPTEEMVAYKEKAGSDVTDYSHGSGCTRGLEGDMDGDDQRPADQREIEMKKLEALQLAELALSKLEFLEVTKKGLSKLQILLIELETRHQDWQAGGLTTTHFLEKLRGANWQLEQYEGSAAPTGWVCSWDRDYRRYFYTHKHTGKTQWDYPDADDIKAEEDKMKQNGAQKGTDAEPEISSSSDRFQTFSMETELPSDILANVALPPPPPPPAEEHPSVKSLMLMYGSSSESEGGEDAEASRAKKKQKKDPEPSPPLPPLPATAPPVQETEERKDRHERHKKKKKKEKSKKKEKEKSENVTTLGPMQQAAAHVTDSSATPSAGLSNQEGVFPNNQPPPPGETYYPQHMVTNNEVPVYGSATTSEMYGQNDQPLEFGAAPEPMDFTPGGEPAISQPAKMAHPPEVYAASSTVGQYATPGESGEGVEGIPVPETPATLTQNIEEKKKKKKSDKMGSANISLKKKHVSSMVQKWQKVKKEVELEERDRAIREAEIRKKLAELE